MKLTTERRALLAFAISMLMFVAYDALYLGPKMKEQRAKHDAEAKLKAQQEAAAHPGAQTDSSLAGAPATGAPANGAFTSPDSLGERPEKKVIVTSPLYEITLSSRGGEIVSAKLLHYLTDGKPVELIPAGQSWSGRRMLAVSLKSDTSTLPLDGIGFDISSAGANLQDGSRIIITGTSTADVVFRAQTASGIIERTYHFRADEYQFDATVRAGDAVLAGAQNVAWTFGPGIGPTEASVQDDYMAFKANALLGEEFHRKRPAAFGRQQVDKFSGTLSWATLQTKYFLAALYPDEPTRADVEMTGVKQQHRVTETVSVPMKTAASELKQSMHVYMGPLDVKLLAAKGVGLERNVEMGFKPIRPVSSAVLWSMKKLYHWIPNYGVVVIIISVLTKVLFYRLTHKSFKSMKQLQDLQPQLQAIKDKYSNDRKRMSEETMRLYKEAGVNPLGGCLPMVLQMPVFIALFNVFRYTIELRGAPFVGWINDLSRQDVLFHLPFTLPLIGNAFSLLPLIMGGAMFAQSKLGGSPTGQSSTAMPAGFNTVMPIVFTLLFYKMPSGLVIYWIINTGMSVVQQYYIHKNHTSTPVAVVDSTPKKTGGAKSKRS
ncbi:MAG TPA: membrane protein insertase YidC [Candidatus Krumholzibacteria bacterium]|nr:membrane protein insertase YidC [Candidatus Krumholzibacteria bacterium]